MRNFYCLFITLFFLVSGISAQTPGLNKSIRITATVQSAVPRITLQWQTLVSATSITVYRKLKNDASFYSGTIFNLPVTATAFADSSAQEGIAYEYQIIKAGGNYAQGYILSGVNIPAVDDHGILLLVVDTTLLPQFSAALSLWEKDVKNEGWQIQRIGVTPADAVTAVKARIKQVYDANPSRVKTVLLFGDVPVPYSGQIAPDGHTDHVGAWPADGYYADMNGTWTDATVNSTANAARIQNVPGDGKFDQSSFPSDLELEIGRVDMSNLPQIGDQATLLRRYLVKDRAFRRGSVPVVDRALVDDNFTGYAEGFSASAWRTFTAMVGRDSTYNADYFTSMRAKSYLWSYGCGGGSYTSASGIGSSSSFPVDSLKGVFTLLFGSYFGDWDVSNNFLRSSLGGGSILTSAWSGRPFWYFHHTGLGETMGFSALKSMNNSSVYEANSGARGVHTAFMGDPTLNTHPVKPPSNVIAAVSANTVQVSWTAAAEPVAGYHVYRKTPGDATYQRITTDPVPGTSFTEPGFAEAGVSGYLVRSIKLITTPSGTYFNLSTGEEDTVSTPAGPPVNPGVLVAANQTLCSSGDPAAITFATLPSGASSFTFQWYFRDGLIAAPGPNGGLGGWTIIVGASANNYNPPAGLTTNRTYACRVIPSVSIQKWAAGVRQITALPPFNPGTIAYGDQSLCSPADPANITLSQMPSGSGAYTYKWYYQNSLVPCPSGSSTTGWTLISQASGPSFDPAAGATTTSRTFAVMVVPGGSPSCGVARWASNCRKITVPAPFNRGTLASGNQTLAAGGDPAVITFSSLPTGGGAGEPISGVGNPPTNQSYGYQWYYKDGIGAAPTGTDVGTWLIITEAVALSYDPPAGLASSRTYACFVTLRSYPQCGTSGWASGARQVTIGTLVFNSGTLATGNQTICFQGDPALIGFQTAPSGVPNVAYQWYSKAGIVAAPAGGSVTGWTIITGATGASYDPGIQTASITFACFVIPSAGAGQWAAGARQITVLTPFNPGTVLAGNQTFCNSGNPANITLSVNPSGSGAYQWRWYFKESSTGSCPTGSSISGWLTNSTSPNISGSTATGAGISFDPISAGSSGNGRTFAVLITPIANGSTPACGTAQWAASCRKTIVNPCRQEEEAQDVSADEAPMVELQETALFQNIPNPFNGRTQIPVFISAKDGKAGLRIFSVDGKLVKQLELNGEGMHQVEMIQNDLSPGVYFCVLHVGGRVVESKRMVMIE